MSQYSFKTNPFKHQLAHFEKHANTKAVALFWEQGCGKTKPAIDTASKLYLEGKIDCILIVAPNGVHLNWLTDEIPTHMPDEVRKKVKAFCYQSSKASNKGHQQDAKAILLHTGLSVVAISYEGFMTKAGKDFIWKLLRQRRVFYALDEAHKIKSPGAKRTKSIVASGRYASYKRLLTGTPISTGPFDIYSQVKFLNEDFWKDRGFDSFAVFKQHFGIWRTKEEVLREEGYDPGYDQLLGYKNIPELEAYVKIVGDRLTKDEVLDLPPKLFSKRYFEMTTEQKRVYEELVDQFIVELEGGETIVAALAIVRLLRLQQVLCGYLPSPDPESGEFIKIGDKNPRLELLLDICDGLEHPAIIWSRFSQDIDQIMEKLGKDAVRYDGKVSDDYKAQAKKRFQNKEVKFFVANPQGASEGLTLTSARTVIYYCNSYKLIERLQSEDRPHRIGQEFPVNYIDICCPKTIDEQVIKNLRGKFDIASQITGDQLKEWI